MDTMLVIDGHNLLFRMFYGIPTSIKNPSFQEIKGVVGFIQAVGKYLDKFNPKYLMVVFDSVTSTINRSSDYAEYKSNRIDYTEVPVEENPFTQLSFIYRTLNYLGVCFAEVAGYEADDYIASLCSTYGHQYKMVIVSTDRDFLQLVCGNVSLYSPRGNEGEVFTPERVYERYGVHPCQIVEYKALVGDASDNIKGVRGIGPKTAVKILSDGSLNEIMGGQVCADNKLMMKLIENKEIIERNVKLITFDTNVPVHQKKGDMGRFAGFDSNIIDILKESGVY